ncbi:hypothetical protein BJX99DRAFT_254067 [Aspergillus californicus]
MELLSMIFGYFARAHKEPGPRTVKRDLQTLMALARTTQPFLRLAQKLLYDTIHLSSMQQVELFFRTVTDRQDLAGLVQRLVVFGPSDWTPNDVNSTGNRDHSCPSEITHVFRRDFYDALDAQLAHSSRLPLLSPAAFRHLWFTFAGHHRVDMTTGQYTESLEVLHYYIADAIPSYSSTYLQNNPTFLPESTSFKSLMSALEPHKSSLKELQILYCIGTLDTGDGCLFFSSWPGDFTDFPTLTTLNVPDAVLYHSHTAEEELCVKLPPSIESFTIVPYFFRVRPPAFLDRLLQQDLLMWKKVTVLAYPDIDRYGRTSFLGDGGRFAPRGIHYHSSFLDDRYKLFG